MSEPLLDCFASCPRAMEYLLADELKALSASNLRNTVSGVYFSATQKQLYQICLGARVANRVMLCLSEFPATTGDALYEGVKRIDWSAHMSVNTLFAVDFSGRTTAIRHSHFGALRVKDAIVDYFKSRTGNRPSVDAKSPELRINVRLNRGKASVNLDMSGESLHRRGYRIQTGPAPIKENLAAAVLLRSGWPDVATKNDSALIDPLCGSGTFLIEAAMMAMGIAPTILRREFGFEHWLPHRSGEWRLILNEAREQRQEALARPSGYWPEIRGYDRSLDAIQAAETNIQHAGLAQHVRVVKKALHEVSKPSHRSLQTGLVVTNPPYGERLGDNDSLLGLYQDLGDCLKQQFSGWQAGVITGNIPLAKRMGLRSHKQYQFWNGQIESKLLLFAIEPEYFVNDSRQDNNVRGEGGDHLNKQSNKVDRKVSKEEPAPLSDGAQMVANRLRKNAKQLAKWLKQQQISCYRLYDADMPEYAAAIDCYENWVHVAEYAAPEKISTEAAQRRFAELIAAIPVALQVDPDHIVIKQRKRQKSGGQYERRSSQGKEFVVREGRAKLRVNLNDYLDTGLFLDHRPIRLKFAEIAKGKRFLNLFCYTASASVHAAIGGAKSTTNVDMSATYLSWAERNFKENGIEGIGTRHQFIRANCLEWLSQCQQRFDIIFLDPPTFSRSKRMDEDFDVQRDHVNLISDAMNVLDAEGELYFSTNLRRFKMDLSLSERFSIEDISRWSRDRDFSRNEKIHQCWRITQK